MSYRLFAGERAERSRRASRTTYSRLTVERGRVFNARLAPDAKICAYTYCSVLDSLYLVTGLE